MRIEQAEFSRSALALADFPRDGRPQVAFVGRSNVGKSTLLNRLLGKKGLARTSSTPGRTQAVNFFLVNDRFYCVDLPGYGYAKAGWDARRAWAGVMDVYLRAAGAAGLARVVLLVDGVVGATTLDVQAWQYLREIGLDGDGGGDQDRQTLARALGPGAGRNPGRAGRGGRRDPDLGEDRSRHRRVVARIGTSSCKKRGQEPEQPQDQCRASARNRNTQS